MSKIEAIYPLTYMQQALLFHGLQQREDLGFLQVECTLEGALHTEALARSWQEVVRRHAAMRTSVHWEKIEKPVQVVHPAAKLPIVELDWRSESPERQVQRLEELRREDRARGFDLTKVPVSRLHLIRLHEGVYRLIWSCHHILLDGWSASILLKDVFSFYESILQNTAPNLPTLPAYRTYLGWLKQQDLERAATFWRAQWAGFQPAFLTDSQAGASGKVLPVQFSLSQEHTAALTAYARRERITLNSLIQGLWALLLSRYTGQLDVAFGTTVSGRSADIPNLEHLAGLFMNVLPVRTRMSESANFGDWLREQQQQQLAARQLEFVTLNQILSWNNLPGQSLFDTLLVVENFPWEDLSGTDLRVKDFKGGITSTYPLTIVVIPGEQLSFEIRYDSGTLSEAYIRRFLEDFRQLLERGNALGASTPLELIRQLQGPAFSNGQSKKAASENQPTSASLDYVAPQNNTELQLVRIWETLFGQHPIGTTENFFELGGTSLLAVRLFARIEQDLKRNLPPVTLFQHPTIRGLAQVLESDGSAEAWSALVPIRASGRKEPLFCIHAGGGHVFFYNALASHLDPDRPVYAVQPVGLDGSESAFQENIEEMARHYVAEMRSVQPTGPYYILGTCFSNAVGFEMAKMLRAAGETVAPLIIVDSAVIDLGLAPEEVRREQSVKQSKSRLGRLLHRYRHDPLAAIRQTFRVRTRRAQLALEKRLIYFKSEQERNLRNVQKHLVKLYLNYEWSPYDGPITLIRSREFHDRPNLAYHLTQWQALTKEELEVHIVPGRHDDLFDEPHVQHLARTINKCLQSVSEPTTGSTKN